MDRRFGRSTNGKWGTNQDIKPISKTFEILDATEGCPKPFYIYSFNIWKSQDNSEDGSGSEDENANIRIRNHTGKISVRVRNLVLTKAIDNWLAENQPENSFYHVSSVHKVILTQFAFQGSEFADEFDEEIGKRKSCFQRKVTIKNATLVDSQFVPVDETYNISFSTVVPPVMNLNLGTSNRDVGKAIECMILADIQQDGKFACARSKHVHKFADVEEDPRTIRLSSCLKMTLGLTINIKQFPSSRVEGEISTKLKIYESWNLFFEPVNMLKLLQEHFEFDISGPLEPYQINILKNELQWQIVEMRANGPDCEDQDRDPNKLGAENYTTCIKDISFKTVAEEMCEFLVETTKDNPTGEITVEGQFRHEFPSIELEYTHLPCLISPQGRKMPIEVCWIKRGRSLERRPTSAEMQQFKQITYNQRLEIYEENCRELLEDHGATLQKFGFKLWPDRLRW